MALPRKVSVRDLQQALRDIEDWTAEVRQLLAGKPSDMTIATIDKKIELPKVPTRPLSAYQLPAARAATDAETELSRGCPGRRRS